MRYSTALILSLISLLALCTSATASERPATLTYATHDQEWYPIDYRNEQGDFVGIFEDIFHELFDNQLGVQTTIVRQPWNRSQMDVRNGNADILITVPTPDRSLFTTTVPTPYFSIQFHLLVPKAHPKFAELSQATTVDDLLNADVTLVSTYGNGWYEATIKAAGVKTEYVETDEQQIRFLLAGRADALIDFPLTMKPLLIDLDPNAKLVFTTAVFSKTNLHVLVGNQSPWASHIELIDNALKSLQEKPEFSTLPLK